MTTPSRINSSAADASNAIDISAPWGKYDAETGPRHHLAHHCADVAMCFLAMARGGVIKSRLEQDAGRRLSDTDLERLAVLVFLHDTGKLHPGFQAKGWREGVWKAPLFGHVEEGLEVFLVEHADEMLPAAAHLRLDALIAWDVQHRGTDPRRSRLHRSRGGDRERLLHRRRRPEA